MNRLHDFEIGGRTLRLNCSVQAALEIGEEYGSMQAALDQIDQMTGSKEPNSTEKGIALGAKLVSKFAVQGKRYCDLTGEQCDKPYTADELLILLAWDPSEARRMFDAMKNALREGSTESVAVETPKNADTTPAEED